MTDPCSEVDADAEGYGFLLGVCASCPSLRLPRLHYPVIPPRPQTIDPNPRPEPPDPRPQTPDHKPQTLNPIFRTLDRKPKRDGISPDSET